MKIWRLKINSSVVIFNLGVFLFIALSYITGFITGNEALIREVFGPTTAGLITMIGNLITIWLRSSNLKGLPPIEWVRDGETQE